VKRLLINGIGGQMGAALLRAVKKDDHGFEIVAGVDPFMKESVPFPVFSSAEEINIPVDVVIDFSVPKATEEILAFCLKQRIPAVICTTALSDELIRKIGEASRTIPVFRSGNMSIGVNLMRVLLKQARLTLGDAFDIEIIETHHNRKKDAPSGTALMLADAVSAARDLDFEYTYDRHAQRKKRDKSEIGIHAVRGGTIVGEHEVIFAGNHEVITLSHSAQSKELFAAGAVNAAVFMCGKPAGLYDMSDLI